LADGEKPLICSAHFPARTTAVLAALLEGNRWESACKGDIGTPRVVSRMIVVERGRIEPMNTTPSLAEALALKLAPKERLQLIE
jgi:hypothetical protein